MNLKQKVDACFAVEILCQGHLITMFVLAMQGFIDSVALKLAAGFSFAAALTCLWWAARSYTAYRASLWLEQNFPGVKRSTKEADIKS